MKKLTMQEMTDAQQMRVKTRIGQERKKLGRELTNSELNKVKDSIITEISLEVEKATKKVRAQKKKDKLVPSDATYSWSSNNHSRGYR
ncbi:DUF3811 domain-containing protein [Proteus hauseri]|uniref:DUF3811 domain-containing protein n=1 Tax=Proteus hauseri TaxID=183417 RepID=UPI0032DB59E9